MCQHLENTVIGLIGRVCSIVPIRVYRGTYRKVFSAFDWINVKQVNYCSRRVRTLDVKNIDPDRPPIIEFGQYGAHQIVYFPFLANRSVHVIRWSVPIFVQLCIHVDFEAFDTLSLRCQVELITSGVKACGVRSEDWQQLRRVVRTHLDYFSFRQKTKAATTDGVDECNACDV